MNRPPIAPAGLALLAVAGCVPAPNEAPSPPPPPRPSISRPAERPQSPAAVRAGAPEVSFDDTEKDKAFAEFLRDHSGGMIAKASVGIERKGMLRVVLDRSVAPDDTLELTKSLMAGARKDFPDRPITLAVFDPGGEPILKSRYKPGQGVQYELAHQPAGSARPEEPAGPAAGTPEPLKRSGVTEGDRKFVAWAEDHGKAYLRYVEADLEKHGRLWFGVTREVKPADVPELTKSLLEGARKEFPRGDLVATVFDPEGERIGRAHLESGGRVRWEK